MHGTNPATSERTYSEQELQWLKACERYKREHRRPHPTWCEILSIAISLGYRQIEPAGELPKPPM